MNNLPSVTMPSMRLREAAGFTLIELMVALGIAVILLAIATPSFSELIAKQKVRAAAADLYVALVKTRSEALKRNTNVRILPNTAGQWQAGWSIFDPDPVNSGRKIDDHSAISGATIVGPSNLTYRDSGRVLGGSAPSFDISASGTTTHWCVTVDLSGRPYQKKTSC